MKNEFSSGVLVYRIVNVEDKNGNNREQLQVLLGKCGGPKWDRLDYGVWNIPKGHIDANDSGPLDCAIREFKEETGLEFRQSTAENPVKFIDLGKSSTKSGKIVQIYGVEENFPSDDSGEVKIMSNMVETADPANPKNKIQVPELSRACYFEINKAKRKIFAYQRCFLDNLENYINNQKSNNIAEQIDGCATPAAAAPVADASASTSNTAGLTTDTVFGSGKSATDSLVKPKEKSKDDPGLTTSDIHTLYTLSNNRKYPLFRRAYTKRRKH